eukprot:CAMPEP_0198226120 /NCGR_PEP_ID=MMETSP1445-20131203/103974_1 /TAXON_ID=36898 /ORGANISM="Pyramimonas sp., Strain CCMP2087" /LENGTH=53 /DNA_ID=CAMNT_0043905849 /DNA_START=25 /DNA_END=186 /DNA_ORIENTATION=-
MNSTFLSPIMGVCRPEKPEGSRLAAAFSSTSSAARTLEESRFCPACTAPESTR